MNLKVKETPPVQAERADGGQHGQELASFAFEASSLLKVLGHEGRLTILNHLRDGGKTVGQLKELMPASQSVISSHLARLRYEGLVKFKKVGKSNFYVLSDDKARLMIDVINGVFCGGLHSHR